MKQSLYFIAIVSISISISHNLSAAELLVKVNNIQQTKGSLYVSVYKDEQGFNANNNFVEREKIPVDNNTLLVKLGELPKGEYAIKAYQDVNDNGQMDFHNVMPAEPYGSSSNGNELVPPNFNNAKFTLSEDQTIQIKLLK